MSGSASSGMNRSARTTARESFPPSTLVISACPVPSVAIPSDFTHARSVDGKRYFETGALRASFVRPDKVTVGDFPELDPFADEDDEEEMEM